MEVPSGVLPRQEIWGQAVCRCCLQIFYCRNNQNSTNCPASFMVGAKLTFCRGLNPQARAWHHHCYHHCAAAAAAAAAATRLSNWLNVSNSSVVIILTLCHCVVLQISHFATSLQLRLFPNKQLLIYIPVSQFRPIRHLGQIVQ